MSLRQAAAPYQHGEAPTQAPEEDSDIEEEVMVRDYQEQVQYDDGIDGYDPGMSIGVGATDIQAQLIAAATPLEFGATLDTKFQSYDNYCTLFHYILNSDGPVDPEMPSVRRKKDNVVPNENSLRLVLLALGCH